MTDFHFTGRELIANGWDGDFNTLEEFKGHLKAALELGWNPKEMTMMQFYARLSVLVVNTLSGGNTSPDDLKRPLSFETNKKNDSSFNNEKEDEPEVENEEEEEELTLSERRRHAEEMGWDEEEMNLEEFEDYFL